MLTDQPFCGDPCLGPATAGDRAPFDVGGLRHPHENRQSADVLADPLRCPHAFGDLRPGIGREEDHVADLR